MINVLASPYFSAQFIALCLSDSIKVKVVEMADPVLYHRYGAIE